MRPGLILDRWECRFLRASEAWLLVYGRRKTGKTWLLRNCIDWSLYATITWSGDCILEERGREARVVGLSDCMNKIVESLKRSDRTVVLDEFQRLPVKYWDLLALAGQEAESRLIACGSSLGIVRRVFERRSPLLGVFEAFHVGLVDVADAIKSLYHWGLGRREAVLWSVVVRDPWILMHVKPEGSLWEVLVEYLPRLALASRGLIGEVFVEEERHLTRVYESTLQLLAKGYWRANDIAVKLYEAGLTSSPQPGIATGILMALEGMGLVERVPLWKTRGSRVYYRHRSPLVSLLYWTLDLIEEPDARVNPEALKSRYGIELQFTLGELLAKYHGLKRAYSIRLEGRDIDVVLLDKRGMAVWGYEVKMGGIDTAKAQSIAEWMRSQGVLKTGIITLQRPAKPPRGVDETLDLELIVERAIKLSAKQNNYGTQ